MNHGLCLKIESMAGGTNVHRRIHDASLGRAEQKIPGRERKNRGRTKRGRRSNAQVSLDNADAVIEGGPAFQAGLKLLIL